MRQAFHIFRKDVRHLRWEIALTLLAFVAFVIAELRHVELVGVLLPILWCFLIARAIHAEALPGYRQFWLTRPYHWKSLLAAKLLFAIAFVNLPLIIADLAILHGLGFSIVQEIPGLLWNQVLLIAGFLAPAAAFAAVTSGLGELILASSFLFVGSLLWLMTGWWVRWTASWLQLEWVRTYLLGLELSGAAVVILLWQYARRQTHGARLLACAIVCLLLITNSLLPWTAAFGVQTHVRRNDAASDSIHVQLDVKRKWLGRVYATEKDQVAAELPLVITGAPSGTVVQPNGLTVTLQAPDGETWTNRQPPPSALNLDQGIISLRTVMGQQFYLDVKDKPLRLRGRMFLTLYGHEQVFRIPPNNRAIRVNGVGTCSAGTRFLRCDSSFRAPLAAARFVIWQGTLEQPGNTMLGPFPTSYSPFPADFGVNPVSQSLFFPRSQPLSEVEVHTTEPLAHAERDFEIRDVRLSDFATTGISIQSQ